MAADADRFEKLGAFYLGRLQDVERGEASDELLLYDSRDLVTHAVCVGMTGSGKTGLCTALLEEAAIDGVPSLVIDPKGDLGSLLLTFPHLAAEDFLPWVEDDEARRQGISREELAERQAELWRSGLARWGEDGARIERLRQAADFHIFTPGSEAGEPLSILASLAAPSPQVAADADLSRERVHTVATSLLGLLGIDADPVRSREYILLSSLLGHFWSGGRDLDLAGLIQAVQSPPLERIGVMELESFFPASDRFGLATALNNLLASPTFQAWTEGEPLDVDRLLHDPSGRPRVSILSIAHLSDAERMFFVSLLLSQVLGWVRGLPGTGSLRAILYLDEVFGFLPPVAEPPSKRPLLTLLKQARASGLGVVLATQNPVDLDYKALSNIGTWFIGRLQTERDRDRVLQGLEGLDAGGSGLDRQSLEEIIGRLGKRVFLLHDVHEEHPVVFETRWVLSYLRGPLTRPQIRQLASAASPAMAAAPAEATAAAPPATPASAAVSGVAGARPLLPPEVPQAFLPPDAAAAAGVTYRPWILGFAEVGWSDRKLEIDHHEALAVKVSAGEGERLDWEGAEPVSLRPEELLAEPLEEAAWGSLDDEAAEPRSYAAWSRELAAVLARSRKLELFRSAALGAVSRPGESERDFRIRLADEARERRDEETGKLRQSFAPKASRLAERIRRAEQTVEREADQARQQQVQTAISFGSTLLSAFLGRKSLGRATLGRATTAFRGVGRAAKERQDVARAEENLAELKRKLEELDSDLQERLDALADRFDLSTEVLEPVVLKPTRSRVRVSRVVLAWAPEPGGSLE